MVFTNVDVQFHADGTELSPNITYIDDGVFDGKFYNFGVQALAALKAHKTIDIHYPEGYDDESSFEKIIPYHAVLEWSVTKNEEEYTKPEDDFCKSESTGDITLFDGTYEFSGDETRGMYRASLDKCYDPANVTVTIDGTTAILPKFAERMYGEFEGENVPVFTTYPAAVSFVSGEATLIIAVPTAGEHTVKVTVPNGSETRCGGK